MASEKILKFVEDIKTLSVLELSELVDAIQEEFGVTAAIAAAPAAGGAAGAVSGGLRRRGQQGGRRVEGHFRRGGQPDRAEVTARKST